MATKKAAGKSTVGGPTQGAKPPGDAAARKAVATQKTADAFPFNTNKPAEIGDSGRKLKPGFHVDPASDAVGASTLTEARSTGKPEVEAARTDATGAQLTTNFGQPIADNQNSLKAGLRGPTLLEDFILREKITHFDHERIPERIVHAR